MSATAIKLEECLNYINTRPGINALMMAYQNKVTNKMIVNCSKPLASWLSDVGAVGWKSGVSHVGKFECESILLNDFGIELFERFPCGK